MVAEAGALSVRTSTMSNTLAAMLCALLCFAVPAQAQDRVTLGFGRLFSNDYLGDGADRWRSGSYAISVLRGKHWAGALPQRPFELIEYRIASEIIAPSRLRNPPEGDRRYAGILSVQAHTHFEIAGLHAQLGAGLVGVGPATGVGTVHRELHRLFSMPRPVVLENQLENALYMMFEAEIGREFEAAGVAVRPFAQARFGDEDLLRAGIDIRFGAVERGALLLRDPTTGHRYAGISGRSEPGVAFVLGADIARVGWSAWLPAADGIVAHKERSRLRAGVELRGQSSGLFYGLTWLSEEFVGQPEGQIVGSLRYRRNF